MQRLRSKLLHRNAYHYVWGPSPCLDPFTWSGLHTRSFAGVNFFPGMGDTAQFHVYSPGLGSSRNVGIIATCKRTELIHGHSRSIWDPYASFHSSRGVSSVSLTSNAKERSWTGALSSPRVTEIASVLQHYGRCYWELSKARLSMLVVTTTGAGFVMGSDVSIDWIGLSWTCLGTMFVAAAANTINQILEVGSDSQMKRTMRRPLPAARIGAQHAMAWAVTAGITGLVILSSKANMVAAGLGAANLVLYTLAYTPLKQVHPINTWVGAVVGAVPPLLGWAAAAGEVGSGGWILASALFFWQIPHFMAVAYLCRQDYAAGGFKMLSVLDFSGQRTAMVALRNCIYLLPLGFVASQLGVTTDWFGLETAILTAGMGSIAAMFYHSPNAERARKLFRASLLYLPLLMAAMLLHRCPNHQADKLAKQNVKSEILDSSDLSCENELIGVEQSEGGQKILPLKQRSRSEQRPPVAYLSIAPFPFLPAPDYSEH